jgi:hypothetical protein
LPVLSERGYLITAQNSCSVDYVGCAIQLARSLRQFHPDAKIALLTDSTTVQSNQFDYHVTFTHPLSDNPYANDWQVFGASPFRQTIKLEADMVVASEIDHWWTMLEHRDVVISTGARDFYDQPATSRFYRKVFDTNNLPDVYNAITYWRLSETAQQFFQLVRRIFEQWAEYKTLLKFPDEVPSTDLVYAMAAQIIGPEMVTMPFAAYPRIVHMKRHMIHIHSEDWTQELTWEYDPLRINTVAQWGAVHYHVKDWRYEQ